MLFGKTEEERGRRLWNWYRWFAWFPVRLTNGASAGKFAWLQKVERKGQSWYYLYREVQG